MVSSRRKEYRYRCPKCGKEIVLYYRVEDHVLCPCFTEHTYTRMKEVSPAATTEEEDCGCQD
jgi:hypothetical protein